MMTAQQVPFLLQQHPSIIAQKVQLTHKLFLLENARSALEQELRNFINQAYEDVRSVLNSSFSTTVFSELSKALDVKCQKVAKLSALLKGLALEPQVCFQPAVKNRVRTNHLQAFRIKKTLLTDVLKFGPMLHNSFTATSIAKAIQVLGAALSHQPLNLFLNFQSASVQQDDMSGSISPSFNKTDFTKSSSCRLKVEEQVVFKEISQSASVGVPPAIAQNHKVNEENPQVLQPPSQAVFPGNSNPKPLVIWGHGNEIQVQNQKQTSSQLLHFLRIKCKNKDVPEVTLLEWTEGKYDIDGSDSPQRSSLIQTQGCQLKYVSMDEMIDALPPKALHTNVKKQTPIFRMKRVKSSGTLIYSCVIATETELWDMGDIFVEVLDSLPCSSERAKECQNIMAEVESSCVNIDRKTQDLQPTEPEQEGNSADAERQTPNDAKIPEFQIRRFEEIEVVVSHIVSPDNFYIQHVDSSEKLQALITDNCKGSRAYAEKNCIPDIGTQVIGWFPQKGQWCRAQVMKICGVSRDNNDGAGIKSSIKVEVKRLDYGDTFCLSLWNMKELHPEMAVLPLQALQVSLANVTPVNGRDWSEEAVSWLKAMVHNRTLYARLYPQGPKVTVELFIEKGKLGAMRRGASLSLRLAQNGHGRHNELKNAAPIKKSTVQLKTQKQDSDWEKYLISCYTQIKK